jgi:hypothetical protein
MTDTNSPETCKHELIFSPKLDDAASCARCGAIALIETREHKNGAAHITWVSAARTASGTSAIAELAMSD